MILFPAIDLYAGKVVRLTQGAFDEKTVYGDDPYETAKAFAEAGSSHLHIVDLEGAEAGYPKHLDVLSKIGHLGLKIQYGGGLRSKNAIHDAIRAGAHRLMIGSLLFRTKGMACELHEEFGEAIIPSIDVKGGKVAISGWMQRTDTDPAVCLEFLTGIGYRTFLVTSVERDGMMQGPDMALYRDLLPLGASISAAGGVSSLDDIRSLAGEGLYGAVIDKALYERRIDLAEALAMVGSPEEGGC